MRIKLLAYGSKTQVDMRIADNSQQITKASSKQFYKLMGLANELLERNSQLYQQVENQKVLIQTLQSNGN